MAHRNLGSALLALLVLPAILGSRTALLSATQNLHNIAQDIAAICAGGPAGVNDARATVDALEASLLSQIRSAESALTAAQREENTRRTEFNRIRDSLLSLDTGGDLPSPEEIALFKKLDSVLKVLEAFNSSIHAEEGHQYFLDFLREQRIACCDPDGRSRERLAALVDKNTGLVARWRVEHGNPETLVAQTFEIDDQITTARAQRRGPDGYAQHRALRLARGPAEDGYVSARSARRAAQEELDGLRAQLAALPATRQALQQCGQPSSGVPPAPSAPAGAGFDGDFGGRYTLDCSRNRAALGSGTFGFALHIDSNGASKHHAAFQGFETKIPATVTPQGYVSGSGANLVMKGLSDRVDGEHMTLSFFGQFERKPDGLVGATGRYAIGDGQGFNCAGSWTTW